MDKILETVMNFINENTTLLIIICVFLIFVLIGYLIDNSIKTRKLEKQMKYDIEPPKGDNEEVSVVSEEIPEEKEEQVEKVEEKPAIDPDTEIDLDFRTAEEKEADNNKEEPEEVEEEIGDTPGNEITVDPKINDMLLRDFSTNGISEVEEEKEEITLNPIDNSKTFDMPEVKEEKVEEKPVYKNSKKLSDIINKNKKEETSKPELNSTMDFSNELDRILQKLNENEKISNDSTLDETQDYTNMF